MVHFVTSSTMVFVYGEEVVKIRHCLQSAPIIRTEVELATDGTLIWPASVTEDMSEYGMTIDLELLQRIRRVHYKTPDLSPDERTAVMQFIREARAAARMARNKA